ncbi:MAG: Ig-like domain-containing protein [Muribaculaceae bacterium]
MRLKLILAILLLAQASAYAELNGDGYYRVQNFKTQRYVYVTDNKGRLDYATTSADMGAIELWLGFEKASTDPATVCYVKHISGSQYDIQSQGTGIYEIISTYVKLYKLSNGTYYAYGEKGGMTKYLGDGEKGDCDEGVMSGETTGDYRKWWIKPIDTDDNYFGVKTDLSVGGKHYRAFYTEFPYSFASSGMKAYYVSKVDNGMAVMKEITDGVPGETPVFIETSSNQPKECKLNIGAATGATPSDNKLTGVYFNTHNGSAHSNYVAYNANTMRVLGKTSDGKLGFVTAVLDYIPANSCYLKVESGSPAELKLVTEEEYEEEMNKYAQSISMSQSSAELWEDEQLQLTATVLPENAASQALTWTSSNTAVATVDATGLVKAIAPGTATITATTTDGTNLSATCSVTVKKILATSITLDKTSIEAVEGTQVQLTATVLPAKAASQALTWTSSNTAVATVNGSGLVSIVGAGTATITATTTDGSNLSATCAVTGIAGVEAIFATKQGTADIYTIGGVLVKKGATADDAKQLPAGIYVIGGVKVAIKR